MRKLQLVNRLFGLILVYLPLMKPILATVAVLNALWVWGEFLVAFLISSIPIVIFYLVMQKHIIKGIAAGAVKG